MKELVEEDMSYLRQQLAKVFPLDYILGGDDNVSKEVKEKFMLQCREIRKTFVDCWGNIVLPVYIMPSKSTDNRNWSKRRLKAYFKNRPDKVEYIAMKEMSEYVTDYPDTTVLSYKGLDGEFMRAERNE